jgi:hypothetical protein
LHDCFHEIAALLSVPMSQLQVFDRLYAMRDTPETKN